MATAFIGGGNMATALIGGMLARGAAVDRFPGGRAAGGGAGKARRAVSRRRALRRVHARSRGRRGARRPRGEAAADARGRGAPSRRILPAPTRRSCCRSPPGSASPTSRAGCAGTRRLVRAMPNTPALVGKGISGAFAAASVDAAGRALVSSVLAAAGEQIWVDDEAMLDAVTGVSGSGPAYVFYFLEALEAAARDLGFAAGGRAPARVCHVRRGRRAGRGEPGGARGAARAGDVERRHHRARDRGAGSRCGEGEDRRRGEGRRAARRRAGRRLRPGRLGDVRPGAPLSARHRVRARHLRVPAALHDAMAARAVPQSARAGGRGAHGLGGQARAPRGPRLQGARRVHAAARVGRASSRGSVALELLGGSRRVRRRDGDDARAPRRASSSSRPRSGC